MCKKKKTPINNKLWKKEVKFYVEDETVSHGNNNEGKTRCTYTLYTYIYFFNT